jgi:hypothetical protein
MTKEHDEGMTNVTEPHRDELPPPAAPAIPPPPAAFGPVGPTPSEPRTRSVGHIIAIVAGCLMILPSLGMLAGGITLTVAQGVADDGFFDVTVDRVESDGVAVAAVDLWDEAAEDEDWPWVLDWLDLDIRIEADPTLTTDEIFVGIARTDDVEAYLADARWDEVTDFVDREPVYAAHGDQLSDEPAAIEPPTEQAFWSAQVTGDDVERLEWEARNGDWSVVVMNADGTPGVAADVTVGVQSGAVLPIGILLIVFGGLGTIVSVVLIVIGARGRRSNA